MKHLKGKIQINGREAGSFDAVAEDPEIEYVAHDVKLCFFVGFFGRKAEPMVTGAEIMSIDDTFCRVRYWHPIRHDVVEGIVARNDIHVDLKSVKKRFEIEVKRAGA